MESILRFDLAIFDFFQEHIYSKFLTYFFTTITFIGEDGIVFILAGLIMLCFKKTRKAGVVALASLLIMSILNNEILKPIMNRPRPFNLVTNDQTGFFGLIDWNIDRFEDLKEAWRNTYRFPYCELFPNSNSNFATHFIVDKPSSLSFPSGHTSSAFAFMGGAAFVIKKWKFSVPAFIFATLMGLSRIYVGVHYPTDVIAGAVAGILYAVIGYFVATKIYDIVCRKIEQKRENAKMNDSKSAKAK